MNTWQTLFVGAYGVIALIGFVWSYHQCKRRKKSYGHPPGIYGFYGAFVWADLVVFGAFWTLISLAAFILQDFIFFLLSVSLFWLIRSIGETTYWFLQQFTPRRGNEPTKFWFHSIFHGDSVWFVYQIYWQCITIITLLTTLYLSYVWLSNQ